MRQTARRVNLVTIRSHGEWYTFAFDRSRKTEAMRIVGQFAADPALCFNWYDAALVCAKILEMSKEETECGEQ